MKGNIDSKEEILISDLRDRRKEWDNHFLYHQGPWETAKLNHLYSRIREIKGLAPVALALSLAALFWRILFTSDMLYYRDVFHYSYPHIQFIHDAVRQGSFPFWNPFLSYGEPLLANPNYLFFYPTTLLVILLPVEFAYKFHYVFHFWFAAFGVYQLARRWRQSRAAAFFAAFVFVFSGPVLSLGSFYNHAAAVAWIPWALLLTDRALEEKTRRQWLALGGVLALQFLASEPLTWMTTWFLCATYAFHQQGNRKRILSRENGKILLPLASVAVLALALSGVALLPALSLLEQSQRGTTGLRFGEVTYWSIHPLYLVEMVAPGIFGEALNHPSVWMTLLNGRNAPYYPSMFLGVIPILLALLGWVGGLKRLRGFAAGTCLTLFLLALGMYTPIFGLLYLLFPPLGSIRFPAKFLIPMLLFVALLAGWGVDALRRGELDFPRLKKCFYYPVIGALSLFSLVFLLSLAAPGWTAKLAGLVLQHADSLYRWERIEPLSEEAFQAAQDYFVTRVRFYFPGLIGLCLLGLMWVRAFTQGKFRRLLPGVCAVGMLFLFFQNYQTNPTVPEEFYSYEPTPLKFMKGNPHTYRICHISDYLSVPGQHDPQKQFIKFDKLAFTSQFPPTAPLSFRERLLLKRATMLTRRHGSYNIDVERSFPRFMVDLWFQARSLREDPEAVDRLLAHTNVRYVISQQERGHGGNRLLTELADGTPTPSYLYENKNYAPRAYVAHEAYFTLDPDETLRRLSSERLWAKGEVILAAPALAASSLSQGPQETPAQIPSSLLPLRKSASLIEVADYTPNAVTIEVTLSEPGYVVLLDRYDPSFRAAVDGKEARVYRANQLFRAVPVPEGKHTVHFYFRPRGLALGTLISLLTLIGVLVVAVHERRKSAERNPS